MEEQYLQICVFVSLCEGDCVGPCECVGRGGGTEVNVGELGAHSSVDLVGTKMKRNVSKLRRL